jgi:hypothetical protein
VDEERHRVALRTLALLFARTASTDDIVASLSGAQHEAA